jgi:hypothetical protein
MRLPKRQIVLLFAFFCFLRSACSLEKPNVRRKDQLNVIMPELESEHQTLDTVSESVPSVAPIDSNMQSLLDTLLGPPILDSLPSASPVVEGAPVTTSSPSQAEGKPPSDVPATTTATPSPAIAVGEPSAAPVVASDSMSSPSLPSLSPSMTNALPKLVVVTSAPVAASLATNMPVAAFTSTTTPAPTELSDTVDEWPTATDPYEDIPSPWDADPWMHDSMHDSPEEDTSEYVPPDADESTVTTADDDKIFNEWRGENNPFAGKSPGEIMQTLEETGQDVMNDKYVPLVATLCGILGLIFMLLIAQQMIENPDGFCAKLCKCSIGFFRCICWPCRKLCCCKDSRQGLRHSHEPLGTRNGGYRHELEMT